MHSVEWTHEPEMLSRVRSLGRSKTDRRTDENKPPPSWEEYRCAQPHESKGPALGRSRTTDRLAVLSPRGEGGANTSGPARLPRLVRAWSLKRLGSYERRAPASVGTVLTSDSGQHLSASQSGVHSAPNSARPGAGTPPGSDEPVHVSRHRPSSTATASHSALTSAGGADYRRRDVTRTLSLGSTVQRPRQPPQAADTRPAMVPVEPTARMVPEAFAPTFPLHTGPQAHARDAPAPAQIVGGAPHERAYRPPPATVRWGDLADSLPRAPPARGGHANDIPVRSASHGCELGRARTTAAERSPPWYAMNTPLHPLPPPRRNETEVSAHEQVLHLHQLQCALQQVSSASHTLGSSPRDTGARHRQRPRAWPATTTTTFSENAPPFRSVGAERRLHERDTHPMHEAAALRSQRASLVSETEDTSGASTN